MITKSGGDLLITLCNSSPPKMQHYLSLLPLYSLALMVTKATLIGVNFYFVTSLYKFH